MISCGYRRPALGSGLVLLLSLGANASSGAKANPRPGIAASDTRPQNESLVVCGQAGSFQNRLDDCLKLNPHVSARCVLKRRDHVDGKLSPCSEGAARPSPDPGEWLATAWYLVSRSGDGSETWYDSREMTLWMDHVGARLKVEGTAEEKNATSAAKAKGISYCRSFQDLSPASYSLPDFAAYFTAEGHGIRFIQPFRAGNRYMVNGYPPVYDTSERAVKRSRSQNGDLNYLMTSAVRSEDLWVRCVAYGVDLKVPFRP